MNIKNKIYAAAGLSLLAINQVSAINVKQTKQVTTWDNGQNSDFISTLDTMLGYVVGLLYFIAIVFALYGGFQIKVKKGKTTLINAVIWLIVIFLASIIVNWIISLAWTTIK